ncbi:hypothetical protein [Luteimicrobium album]|uniref:hypothetical protein n=1 Tax=Luteimicrobium album TaxID=1054550 RepID=UPI0024E09D51|nr:hypothetical protein [Luteimicrobium album]
MTPPALRWTRALPFLLAGVAMVVAMNTPWASAAIVVAVLTTVLVGGFATLNVVGPFAMSLAGRAAAGRARRVPALLAGRRIVDSPKTAWRSVGGVALATFVAGLTSVFALVDPADQPSADRLMMADLKTGGSSRSPSRGSSRPSRRASCRRGASSTSAPSTGRYASPGPTSAPSTGPASTRRSCPSWSRSASRPSAPSC